MLRLADHPAAAWVLAAFALAIAALGTLPYAGGWNDGCRLAAVESLLDRGTLAIDDSIFCKPPKHLIDAGYPPYSPDQPGALANGTQDKLFIRGHFHSDKPAVISVLMAGMYQPFIWFGVSRPGDRPDVFCWLITVLTSGLGYAAGVGCMWVLGRRLGLAPGWRLAWVGAFAVSTMALCYTRQVNNHAMHLGVVAGMCLLFHRAATTAIEGRTAWGSLIGLGTLAGLSFNLDFGSGPLLVAAAFVAVALRHRRWGPVLAFSLAVLPWIAAGLGMNYAIAGVWKPINMYPEHHRWAGSPFSAANMTGALPPRPPLVVAGYSVELLFGPRGFVNHNLPVLLIPVAVWVVFRRPDRDRIELTALVAWALATWLLYATQSNNRGGGCMSVRWFLPVLAVDFWLLGRMLADRPEYCPDFAALAAWGAVQGVIMWSVGPWSLRVVPHLGLILIAAALTWGIVAYRRWKGRPRVVGSVPAAQGSPWIERRAA